MSVCRLLIMRFLLLDGVKKMERNIGLDETHVSLFSYKLVNYKCILFQGALTGEKRVGSGENSCT